MRRSTRDLHHAVLEGKHKRRARASRPAIEGLEARVLLSAAHDLAVHKHVARPVVLGYVQTNLVSNIDGMALITDTRLVNPWDVNFPQLPGINPPVYVADQGTGVVTSYQISSNGRTVIKSSSAVTIPTVSSSEPTGPTGVVLNTTDQFKIPRPDGPVAATYIFDTLQGTIAAWSEYGDTTSAQIMVNDSSTAEYTGLAAGAFGGKPCIYAANEGASPGIQVFNGSFKPVPLAGNDFIDPNLPKGFMPYGVRDILNHLYVMYRSPNFQGGAVAEFTNNGKYLHTSFGSDTTAGGILQSPWGMAYIQHGFGQFSGDLVVGNFSSGQIDAYNLHGKFLGKLLNANGTLLTIPGLRTVHFGPGLGASDHTHVAMLFTAETDTDSGNLSLYGQITPAANPT